MSEIWVRCIHFKEQSCLSTPCGNGYFKKYEEEQGCEKFIVDWTTFIINRKHFEIVEATINDYKLLSGL